MVNIKIPQAGFTLIEASMVLVIIGLIIGGVLVGEDLINAAAQRAQISQIEKYKIAVNSFQDKYGGFPGDLDINRATQFGFTVAGCDGTTGRRDGNGLIDGYWSGGTWILQGYEETGLFWDDLSTANLIEGKFPNNGASWAGWCGGLTTPLSLTQGAAYVGDYFPTAKIGNGNFIYVFEGTHPGDSSIVGDNWYGLSAITSVLTNGGMFSNPALSVMQAYKIDQKIDDGFPTTGTVQAAYLSGWYAYRANAEATDSATSCYNTASNTYSIGASSGNSRNCALSFKFQ